MTKVNIVKDIDLIKSIEIIDHAGFASYGQDIVCAGISSIVFGSANALVEFGLLDSNIKIDETRITIVLSDNKDIQVVAQTMIIQLQTIQESYPDYIQINTLGGVTHV